MDHEKIQTYLGLRGLNFEGYVVPEHTQGAFHRYVFNRLSPGSFGEAVLAGDLELAVRRADFQNRNSLSEIDRWIKENLPEEMQGSYDAVRNWCYG